MPELSAEIWTDDDYANQCEESKKLKGIGLGVDRVILSHKRCPDCKRPVANLYDEGIHNTGECGCKTSRSLCWRSWNGNKCVPFSPYDHSAPSA